MGLGKVTIAEGQAALSALIEKVVSKEVLLNEAETRAHIIDKIIKNCLGWPDDMLSFRVEVSHEGKYSDYELGHPKRAIWEAKKEGTTFELPADTESSILCDIKSIISLDEEADKAIRQVKGYCSDRGVEIAVATNGHQLIAFLASRGDGVAPLDGKCLRINSLNHLLKNFPRVWQLLSPEGIAQQHLHRFLRLGEDKALPEKLSRSLPTYPKYRYPSDLQSSLRALSELLLVDLIEQVDVEKRFYEECYCESGALSQHAMISKQMLSARYDALFNTNETSPKVTPMISKKGKKSEVSEHIMTEALALRPVVLLGDVGVGKTSFLKHLMYVRAAEEFRNSIFIYIDLGSKGALSSDLNDFVLSELERQLYEDYEVDIYEEGFIRGVYSRDIQRFGKSIYGSLKDTNPKEYDAEKRKMLARKTEDRDTHLKASIAFMSSLQQKQVVVSLDNADQRNYEIQQEAFIISQNLAKDWKLMVFISVRPQTFYSSKQSGVLTAYPNRVFTISPPRVDQVLQNRLVFALNMAEGTIPVQSLKGIEINLGNISIFIKALLNAIKNNEDIIEFLSNITGGNIRAAIDLVTKLVGSANVDAQKIIDIMSHQGAYLMPVHEFWKTALLGDYSYYDPTTSMALNLFDVTSPNQNEHFLMPMLLSYIDSDGKHRTKEFFVQASDIIAEMQSWGFSIESIEHALRTAINKKLLETPERFTFNEDAGGMYGDLPTQVRITTVGAYHYRKWVAEFSYFDAMLFDTPIFVNEQRSIIANKLNSFSIADRYTRAVTFRAYLNKVWGESALNPSYFNWNDVVKMGDASFQRVAAAIDRIEVDAA